MWVKYATECYESAAISRRVTFRQSCDHDLIFLVQLARVKYNATSIGAVIRNDLNTQRATWPIQHIDRQKDRQWTILHSSLRPTTRECVHLVTRGHFWSRDKDGGHSQNPQSTRILHDSMFYRTAVNADESFTLQEEGFSTFFVPVTLTFIYELDLT